MALSVRNSGTTPFFKTMTCKDEPKSIAAGRPIFVDIEIVEVRIAGSKDTMVARVHDLRPEWVVDEETGDQRQLTYAETWPRQFEQFKLKQQQTKSGTPLDYVPFLTPAKRAELRAFNIYTIEALAEIDGQPLKNLGIGGRELKNRAIEYLASSSHDGTIMRQQAQIDALINQIKLLQEDKQMLTGPREPTPQPPPGPGVPPEPEEPEEEEDDNDGEGRDERTVQPGLGVAPELIGLKPSELKALIIERTGKRPVGNPSLQTLLRIAQEATR